jgi:hypothetical protein
VVKHRSGSRLVGITIKVVYGDPEVVCRLLAEHTSYVERTNLTSRQMNGWLVRKTLSFSKELQTWQASWSWEDWVYNLTALSKPCGSKLTTVSAAGNLALQLHLRRTQCRCGRRFDRSYLNC